MKRKHVAVIIAQPDSTYQKKLLKGLLQEAFARDIDISVFAPFIKMSDVSDFETGEFNIFRMFNAKKFDGVILAPDTVKNKEALDRILNQINKAGLPAVCVDMGVDGFETVFCDDTYDIERIVDHLIEEHGCERIDFFSGFKNHPHSLRREQGYKNSLKKHGIEFEEERIHYGDFWVDETERVADEILNSKLERPQGIACACNDSAISLVEALEKRGYRIPEDFKITGYDANNVETYVSSKVTTMFRDAAVSGAAAVRRLCTLLGGADRFLGFEKIDSDIITASSCGCHEYVRNKTDFAPLYEIDSIYDSDDGFESGHNFMMERIIATDNLHDFIWNAEWYLHYIKDFDGFYICMCDNWGDFESKTVPVDGYSDDIIELYSNDKGDRAVDMTRIFKRDDILPSLYDEKREAPCVFYFSPLHFNERCFGYTVMRFDNKPVVFNNSYSKWMRNVGNAMESLRRQLKLRYFRDKVEELSITDTMTGVYNRNGFKSISKKILKKAKAEYKKVMIILGDIDNMKYINDNFGHIEGDSAVKFVAKTMKRFCTEDEKCFRFGGDEFIILGAGDYSDGQLQKKISKIQKYISDYNASNKKPYDISISIGYDFAGTSEIINIDTLVNNADVKMFEIKKKKERYRK